MTDIKIFKKNDLILGVECKGHTGYAESGSDIVCASLSGIVETAVLGVKEVAKQNCTLKRDDLKGFLKLVLTGDEKTQSFKDSQIILQTMLIGIKDLEKGYSKFIKLEEVNDVY